MSKKIFAEEEMAFLGKSPHVLSVRPKTIRFRTEFKQRLLDEAALGKTVTEIFEGAGLPISIIGYERAVSCYGHWTSKERNGEPVREGYAHGESGVAATKDKDKIIAQLKRRMEMMKAELDFYRQLRRLERRHQPKKSPPKPNTR